MTKEEMEELKGLAASMGLYDDKNPCKRAVILGKAIKELEQEPTTKNDLGVDCISRQAVLEIAKASKSNWIDNSILFKKVNALPSVTPQEPKTGHWILDETDNSITCDKCGCLIWANDISNGEAYFCPNCGAKMDKEQEDV